MNKCTTILRSTLVWMTLLYAAFTVRAQINAEQVMRIGQNALYFDDYVVSIQYFNQAIQAKPYLALPYFYRAIAKLNLDDYLGAELDATEAVKRNPFLADAFEVRGVARQSQGNAAGAVDDYNEALKLLPENKGLLYNKALAQNDINDYEGASETYERLLKAYPKYENAYFGRAQLRLAMGDTLQAKTDLDKAIELNKNLTGAYVVRAEIAIKQKDSDLKSALVDLDHAVKLQPKSAGLYINRAYVRYMTDDFRGAMADYDTSISLDPLNAVSYFNRGLLRMQTLDNDRALTDFNQVLQLDPNDYRALYNRAMINETKGDYQSSVADLSRIVDAFPDFAGARYSRFLVYDKMGDRKKAMKDYDDAMALFKQDRRRLEQQQTEMANPDITSAAPRRDATDDATMAKESADDVARRFSTLVTIENKVDVAEEHNNKSIRGKVQDRNQTIVLEPMFKLSFYADEDAVSNSAIYTIPEVDAANSTRALRQPLVMVLHDTGPQGEDEISRHFQSVDYYNSYLSTHTPRAIDYLGRGMDFMMLHNYQAAIADFSSALTLTPDFALAYLMRANVRYRELKAREGAEAMDSDKKEDRRLAGARNVSAYADMLADIEHVINLSPRMAIAYYNKGCILAEQGYIDGAIQAFGKAIELEPRLGVAFYNRGYLYLQIGDSTNGMADLSRAGELGIVSSYNLLKRMRR